MKTRPLDHQQVAFDRFLPAEKFGLWWDPGLGKTKPTIDIAYEHYTRGDVKRLLVIAPNLVHTNWVTDELPKHGWDGVDARMLAWHASKQKTRGQQEATQRLLGFGGFAIATMTFDGVRTEAGTELARQLVAGGKTMVVCDESHRIKQHDGVTSKLVRKIATWAPVKAALTGTPIAGSPLAAYAQCDFLERDFWKRQGIGTWTAFKHHFALYEDQWKGNKKVPVLVNYQNLDELQRIIAAVGHRLSREEALDLPPQIFVKRRFDLAPEQRRVYKELVERFYAELSDQHLVEVPLAIQRLMKLHQIACGFVMDGDGNVHQICDDMPRLDALEDLCDDHHEQGIIWVRFRHDAEAIMRRLNAVNPDHECPTLGKRAARYDGTVNDRERQRNLAAFRSGQAQWLVANPMSIGIGVTLNEAKVSVYYSQDYKLVDRLQSEARNYRVGQDRGVLVYDFVANDTVDEKLISNLVSKLDIAAQVQGDKWKAWIR